jgi:hypothetical protein
MAAIDKFEVLIKNFINFPELYEQQKGTNEACKAPRMSQNRAPSDVGVRWKNLCETFR